MHPLGSRFPLTLGARRADRFWLAQLSLVLLAWVLAAGLGLAQHVELAGRLLVLCQRSVHGLLDQGWGFLILVPPALGAFSFFLLVLSIWRQWRSTRRLMQALGPLSPLPPGLSAMARRLGLAGRLRLVADTRPLAFCAGLLHPVVWLTTGLLDVLDQDALAAVLRHEGHHVRHRDPLKLLLVRALADAFFFLPLVRDLGQAYQVHKELAADAEAASSPAGQRGLARALLHMLENGTPELTTAAVGPLMLAQGTGATEARLDQLTHGTVPSLRPHRRRLLLTVLALTLFLVVGMSPLAGSSHAEWGGTCGPENAGPAALWLDAPQGAVFLK
jgi:Zn-dependent protease with chaperone function